MKPRSRFARDVFLAFLLVTLSLSAVLAWFSARADRTISRTYIRNVTDRVARDFRQLQQQIEQSLLMARSYGEGGLLDLDHPDRLKELLFPFFKKEPLLSGISLADENGRSWFMLPDGTVRPPDKAGDFDPRTRPWFGPALETDGVYWTDQYRFYTLKQIGVTASCAFRPPKKKVRYVVAFDILLPDFYRRVRRLAPTPNSRIFVFRRDELLFLPENEQNPSDFIPLSAVEDPLIAAAHALWNGENTEGDDVFPLRRDGQTWWCGFHPLDTAHGNVRVGVMVPESDILGEAHRRRLLLWGGGLAVLLLAAGTAFFLVHRYGRRIEPEWGTERDLSPEEVRALIARGENRHVEFKSTMRMNLHTGKPGKEIKRAWLKGVAAFLNTDGGILLLGVSDDGEIIGLETDLFENDDKCRLHFKNLIAAHLGAEFARHIRLQLLRIGGKTVGVVHCSPSPDPVFLRHGNKEAFYIRNGPSSDELPVSKAIAYIKDRKREE